MQVGTNEATGSFPWPFGPYGTSTYAFDELRRSTPVRRVVVPSGWEVWLVTRYADVCLVHKDRRFSREEAVRRGIALSEGGAMELEAGVLQNTDGAEHVRLRNIFARYYTPSHTDEWAKSITQDANEVIDRIDSSTSFDLRADFFEPLSRRSAEKMFGLPIADGPEILQLFFNPALVDKRRPPIGSLLRNGHEWPDGSFLKAVSAACSAGRISEHDLLVNVIVLATVTFEATGGPFLGGMFALLREPEQWELLLGDRSLVPNAVEEMLRCYPNGDGQFIRIALEDVPLGGVQIRRGDAVLAPASAANADPEVFPEPRRFDILRPNSDQHIAFGYGRHACLGGRVATVFMRSALTVLLDRFPSLQLAVAPERIKYRPVPLISIMDRLPVKASR